MVRLGSGRSLLFTFGTDEELMEMMNVEVQLGSALTGHPTVISALLMTGLCFVF